MRRCAYDLVITRMKYRQIRLTIRLRVFTRIIRVMTRSIKAVDSIIPSKIKNVQVFWILLMYRDRENGVTLF